MNSNNGAPLLDPQLVASLPDSTARRLLVHALEHPLPRDGRRVFVNRTLRMETIRFVGFDLDWTLAAYDHDTLAELIFTLGLERLVAAHGYPRAILRAEARPRFARRGLMLDVEAGIVLKMSRHRYVGRAYHGREYLDVSERARLYRHEPVNPASDRFTIADTLFEMPEVDIFSELIELNRHQPERLPIESYQQLARDVRAAIDGIHADGTLKARILADLPRYLPREPELVLALRRLALGGRKLLLITNSEWFYTDALCRYLFDDALPGKAGWRQIFDLVVVSSGKPGFFRKQRPFVVLDASGNPHGETAVPAWGGAYAGGSREGLMKLLEVPGEQVLYVGDHIYGDILSTKMSSTWRTALVLSELEDELAVLQQMSAQQRVLEALRVELGDLGAHMDDLNDVLSLYRALRTNGSATHEPATDPAIGHIETQLAGLRSEHKGLRRHARRVQHRLSTALNPYWGSLFKQGANKSFFGAQVDHFACIYTSRVSNLASYGSNHYFRVMRDAMMHEWGL